MVVFSVACAQHHVRLDPPAPQLSPDQRVALFSQRKAVLAGTLEESINGGPWELVGASIQLADTTEVVSPEDLAPLVDPDSETMRKAHASVRARRHKTISMVTMMVMAGAGLALAFTDVPIPYAPYIGWPLFLSAAIIGMPVTRYLTRTELRLRREAFASYTGDLAGRLNVCARGFTVYPCDFPPAPPEKPLPTTTVPARTAALQMR